MFRFLRARTIVIATGVILIGAGATSASVQASTRAAAPTGPSGINHYLCYSATPATPYPIPNLILKNQFNTNGFVPTVTAQDPLGHCNPVKKTVGPTVSPIVYPNAHLLCYPITAPTQATYKVQIKNQFGKAIMTTGQPFSLCLPTWKSLTGPPNKNPVQPSGVDHFTCYPVTYFGTARFHPPGGISLQDQFSPTSVSVQISDPTALCVPTTKIANGVQFPAIRPQKHLLCFGVTHTPIKPTVFDQNQFGTRQLGIHATVALCLPSFKTIVP